MEIKCPHCGQRNRVPAGNLDGDPTCGKCHNLLLNSPINADSKMLAELIAGSAIPVVVDFWAPWCGPCLRFAPTYQSLAEKLGGTVAFVKVDTEAHQEIGAKFNIRSIPTLATFFRGRELGRTSGALPAAELEKLVRGLIEQAQKV
ncbi:thioredoxin TrxC [Paralcaligenes ureilyticus]|uniref:Thioredoxin n=1 Tax=Paralcaligenes ureilyticus TaxID=627131 RepID=A0A4R3MBI5_9BURK|nr:thioredoxin TrxC [Paralcaligenes ureilyticus]TCT10113.1 thioredoxin [Paralcaligenes ureilyticus]